MTTLILFRKEFRRYFYQVIAYAVLVAFAIRFNIYAFHVLSFLRLPRAEPVGFLEYMFGEGTLMLWVALNLIVPVITMRLFAEERRLQTSDLLMTQPVTEGALLLGKFFAAYAMYIALWVPTLAYVFVVFKFQGEPDVSKMVAGYLGLLLIGLPMTAMGVLASAATSSQLIAVLFGWTLTGALWLPILIFRVPQFSEYQRVFSYLDIAQIQKIFSKGIVDTRAVVFLLSLAALALYVAYQTIRIPRWRRLDFEFNRRLVAGILNRAGHLLLLFSGVQTLLLDDPSWLFGNGALCGVLLMAGGAFWEGLLLRCQRQSSSVVCRTLVEAGTAVRSTFALPPSVAWGLRLCLGMISLSAVLLAGFTFGREHPLLEVSFVNPASHQATWIFLLLFLAGWLIHLEMDLIAFFRQPNRNLKAGLEAVQNVALCLLLVYLANLISYKVYDRWDWTRSGFYALSPEFTRNLQQKAGPLNFTVIANSNAGKEAGTYDEYFREFFRRLQASRPETEADFIDTNNETAMDRLFKKYGQTIRRDDLSWEGGGGGVLALYGDKSAWLSFSKLCEYEWQDPSNPGSRYVKGFRAEEPIGAMLAYLYELKPTTLYFSTGHREMTPRSKPEPGQTRNQFGMVERLLNQRLFRVKYLDDAELETIPADCEILVVNGPQAVFSPKSLLTIREYLKKGGKLYWGADVPSDQETGQILHAGLETLVAEIYGIQMFDEYLLSEGRSDLSLFRVGGDTMRSHPITDEIRNGGLDLTLMTFPRRLHADREKGWDLAAMPDGSRSTNDFLALAEGRKPALLPQEDLKYNYQFAAAAGIPGGDAAAGNDFKGSRVVVVGLPYLIIDEMISLPNSSNRAFFLNAIFWLAQQESRIVRDLKIGEKRKMVIPDASWERVTIFVTIGTPVYLAGLMLLVFLYRRMRTHAGEGG